MTLNKSMSVVLSLFIAGQVSVSRAETMSVDLSFDAKDPAPSTTTNAHLDVLKSKFLSARASLTLDDLVGSYLGRCFTTGSDTPRGMVLTTAPEVVGADEGPLFPSNTFYKSALIEFMNSDGSEAPYTQNDRAVSAATVKKFWAHPQGNAQISGKNYSYDVQFTPVQILNNVATQNEGGHFSVGATVVTMAGTILIKKAEDGFLYAESNATGATSTQSSPVPTNYCYFWKKLF